MKLAPLLALSLAGCSLYLGEADGPSQTDPFSGEDRPGGPGGPGGPYGEPPGGPGGPGDPGDPGGGPLPGGSCGAPEVHVIGVYETHSNHSGGYHPPGDADVLIERPGEHHLVLSAHEPVSWHVQLGAGVKIAGVTLIGVHEQTVNLNVPVTHDTGCGYSYPYNGQGCDTNELLSLAEAHAGAPITSFHGCYHASGWALQADGSVLSNCDTAAGYEVDELYGECGGGCGGGW